MKDTKLNKVKQALLSMQRHSWEQGLAMQSLFEAGEIDLIIMMAYEVINRQTQDGRAAVLGVSDAVTDPCAVGEVLKFAAEHTNDPYLENGYNALLDWAVNKAPGDANGVLYHLDDSQQFWVDSIYMLPPFLAVAGEYQLALNNLYGYIDALYSTEDQLMSHMWDVENQCFIRKDYWGTGNGWAVAGMARMYDLLPNEYADDKAKIAGIATSIIDKLIGYMREDGYFYNVVDDSTTFVETALSSLLAYTIFRGVKSGWLEDKYLNYADLMRKAVHNNVNDYGFVTPVCGAPTFDRPGISPEAQSFFILMESAASQLNN